MLKFGLNFCYKSVAVGITKENFWHQNKVKNVLFSSHNIIRNTSFFNKMNIDSLWDSVTTVSNAGKKRGRGKGTDRKRRVNLYPSAVNGAGPANMFWPGLTGPVVESKTLMQIHKKPSPQTKTEVLRKKKFASQTIHPLLRGWSGRKAEGKKYGPPNPEIRFPNFESVVIENRMTGRMTGNLGRKRGLAVTVLVGNKQGLIGMGRGKATNFGIALRKAKDRAIQKLIPIDFEDGRTVNHDFYCSFGSTRIFVFKKQEGYGLNCHRVLKVCCELLGIKDMAAKVEGASSNTKHVVKAFLLGLLYKQKTFQQIANETKLHVVQFRRESLYYPEVLASPDGSLSCDEIKEKPIFDHYVMDGKIYLDKKRIFEMKRPKSRKILLRYHRRNFDEVKINILAEYGKYRSFLADKYPECDLDFVNKKMKQQKQ